MVTGATLTVAVMMLLGTQASTLRYAPRVTPSAKRVSAHPLHTTLTDVMVDATGLHLTIRGFAADFAAATTPHHDAIPSDSAIGSYVASAVLVVDQTGRRVALGASEIRRTGDLVWITLRAPAVKTLRGVRLACALLVELFDDQVNIVQEAATGQRHSLLFTRGDARTLKPLLS